MTPEETRLIVHFGLDPNVIVSGSLAVAFQEGKAMVMYSVKQEIDAQQAGIAMMVAAGMQIQEQEPEEVAASGEVVEGEVT